MGNKYYFIKPVGPIHLKKKLNNDCLKIETGFFFFFFYKIKGIAQWYSL